MKTIEKVLVFILYNSFILLTFYISNAGTREVGYEECLKTERQCVFSLKVDAHEYVDGDKKTTLIINKSERMLTEIGNESSTENFDFDLHNLGKVVKCYKYSYDAEKPAKLLYNCDPHNITVLLSVFMLDIIAIMAIGEVLFFIAKCTPMSKEEQKCMTE